jgi:hypothetical protein
MVLISTYVGMGIKSVQLPLSGLVNVVDRELAGQVDWVSACLSSPSYTVVHNIEETNNQRSKWIRNHDRSIQEQETVHF